MSDVSADLQVLRDTGVTVLAAADSLPALGDPGDVNGTAVGSPEVLTVLMQVGVEQATRAEAVAMALRDASGRPFRAATEIEALDRRAAGLV